MVPLVEAVFPAMSETVAIRLYTPSEAAENEDPPPLMLGDPETPDVASVADDEAVTGPDLNQPFCPFGAGIVRVKAGGTLSTLMEANASSDSSPKDDFAQ